MKSRVVHDRALLLRGCKRNEVLNLAEIEQSGRSYGRDVASVAIRMPAKQFVVIDLVHGDYLRLLEERRVQEDRGIVTSIAPPWGAALDEVHGLDLRRTTPPIIEVIDNFSLRFPTRKMLFAVQAYEQVSVHSFEPDSHAAGLDRSAQLPHQSKRPEP